MVRSSESSDNNSTINRTVFCPWGLSTVTWSSLKENRGGGSGGRENTQMKCNMAMRRCIPALIHWPWVKIKSKSHQLGFISTLRLEADVSIQKLILNHIYVEEKDSSYINNTHVVKRKSVSPKHLMYICTLKHSPLSHSTFTTFTARGM